MATSQLSLLLLGTLLTIVVLVLFLYMNRTNHRAMQLDAKWIAFACVPIVVALILSGQIDTLKAFDVELKVRLQVPSTNVLAGKTVQPYVLDELVKLKGVNLADDEKLRLGRLTLVYGTEDGQRIIYSGKAIGDYVRQCPNLHSIEVKGTADKFICLVPVTDILKAPNTREPNVEKLDKLAIAVNEQKDVEDLPFAITTSVTTATSLSEAYEIMKEHDVDMLPIVTKNQLRATLQRSDVERAIMLAVIEAAALKK